MLERRLDDGGDPGLQAGMLWFAFVQNKKGGP
jgi:hypothetical protein